MSPDDPPPTPGAMLDQIRAHPEWSDRDRDVMLGRLVERFAAGDLVDAVRPRLRDLGGLDAEALLRIVEANPIPALLDDLARAVHDQPDLPPERAWDALALLDGLGLLDDHPDLAERWEELNEGLDEDGSIQQLAEQIEGDPEDFVFALQGLGAVEPEIRAEIVAGLGRLDAGPGLVEFFRVLGYSDDPATRASALAALENVSGPDGAAAERAWADLAAHHPDTGVVALARRLSVTDSGDPAGLPAVREGSGLDRPRAERSLIGAMRGDGRATILLGASRVGGRASAVFGCDVDLGIFEVYGDVDPPDGSSFEAFAGDVQEETVEGAHAVALALLAGCLTLCGPSTPPALRYWIEATAGPEFRPRPFPAEFPDWDVTSLPLEGLAERAGAVLDARPDWLDDSPLTFEIAEEILLREGGAPDPRRDAGAYRYLFEHRLQGRLERYRRMLLWTAWFWKAGGREDLARSSLAFSRQLADAQHEVPSHPFTVALATRSLAAAQAGLKSGLDPRR